MLLFGLQALTVGLDFKGGPAAGPAQRPSLPHIHGGVLGASFPLGQWAIVYMDGCLMQSPTLEQHLLDIAEVLKFFHRR